VRAFGVTHALQAVQGLGDDGQELLPAFVVQAVRALHDLQRARKARDVRDRDLSRQGVFGLDLAQRAHEAAHDRPRGDHDPFFVARERGLHGQLDAAPADPLLHDALDVRLQGLQAARDVDAHVEIAMVEAAHRDRGLEGLRLRGRRAVPGHGADAHRAGSSGVNCSS